MAGGGHPATFHLEEKWLVDALVAGTVKSVGSSFGTRGFAASVDAYGVDLLAALRSQPGATFGRNCHSDSWYVWPDAVGGKPPTLSRRYASASHRRME